MSKGFEDILEECLEDVLQGGSDIQSCLERFPEQADRLKPLLQVAVLAGEALQVKAPARARQAGRQKVLARGRELMHGKNTSVKPAAGRSWRPRLRLAWKPAMLVAGVLVLLGSGTAMAASVAQPDSILYPVKIGMEDLRTVVALQSLDQAKVEVSHAQARLDEVLAMVDEGKTDQVPSLLDSYDAHMDAAGGDITAAAGDGYDTGDVRSLLAAATRRHDEVLLVIRDRLPDEIRESLKMEMEEAAARLGVNGDDGAPSEQGAMPEQPAATGADVMAPGSGGELDSRDGDNAAPGEGMIPESGSGGSMGDETGGDDGGGYQEPSADERNDGDGTSELDTSHEDGMPGSAPDSGSNA